MNQDLFHKILDQIQKQKDFDQVLDNPIVRQMESIVLTIESKETTLLGCIESIGSALREDYNDEYPVATPVANKRQNGMSPTELQDELS